MSLVTRWFESRVYEGRASEIAKQMTDYAVAQGAEGIDAVIVSFAVASDGPSTIVYYLLEKKSSIARPPAKPPVAGPPPVRAR